MEDKYELEIYLDNWDTCYSITNNRPFINMNIGEYFNTLTSFTGFPEFKKLGSYKIVKKENFIFNENYQKTSYLLDTTDELR